ncbi:DUF2663 family protein [Lederbergia lenta]|uniref:YpbF n=1 Tax=Lederbergia lenta TaxID=1467 RepID=A0A2X4Z773_LEDLE|nr:DUF2663 family protein [Lederbergia lenta]MCM3111591.1 YpbF family protein [Lederbergia lenta]MEC2325021.1 DUF2663 family protein [Lederbergia lenta]SQI56484.1 YpbF [Lederbergia lenta]
MDSFLLMMDEHTDVVTKQMLQSLINKRVKHTRYKTIHFTLLIIAMLYGFIALYVLYSQIIKPYSYTLLDIFSVFLANEFILFFLFCGFLLFGSVKIYFDKKEKAEKEFHELRCEIIDKSKDLWKNDSWGERHKVYKYLKSTYDINLYHESK